MTEVRSDEPLDRSERTIRGFTVAAAKVAAGASVFISVWYVWVVHARFPEIIAPTPGEVAADLRHNPGPYLADAAHSVGFGLAGSLIGLVLGTFLAYGALLLPWARALLSAASVTLRSIPILALTPAIAAVFGYGLRGQLAVTGAISFFPAFVLVTAGGRAIPPSMVETLALAGATRSRMLFLLVAPATAPALLTASRIAAANCVVSAVTAEFLVSNSGLGRRLADSQVLLDSPRTWGIALLTVVCSCTLYALTRRAAESIIRRFS